MSLPLDGLTQVLTTETKRKREKRERKREKEREERGGKGEARGSKGGEGWEKAGNQFGKLIFILLIKLINLN